MSPRSSSPKKAAKAQAAPPDVYVSLMFVALAALIVGIVLLVLELNEYQYQFAPAAGATSPAAVAHIS